MDDLFSILESVGEALEAVRVPYALTGSIASSYYGRPRGSIDADLAVQMTATQADALSARLAGRFYVSVEGLREACLTCGMANLIHMASGLKIDLSVLKPTEYYRQVMARMRQVTLPGGGRPVWMVSAEDVVLMKLEWRKDTRSARQMEDVLGVIQTCRGTLDWDYLTRWADPLGVRDDLEQARQSGDG